MPLALEIVTPEERVVTVTCDEVRLTSVEGQFGIRPWHTPLVAVLAVSLCLMGGAGTVYYAAQDGKTRAKPAADKPEVPAETPRKPWSTERLRRQIEFEASLPPDQDERAVDTKWRDRTKTLNWELFDYGKVAINDLLIDALVRTARAVPGATSRNRIATGSALSTICSLRCRWPTASQE